MVPRMSTLKLYDYAERLMLLLLVAPFAVAFAAVLPSHPYMIALAIGEMLSVLFILIRKPGQVVATPYAITIAMLGTGLPLLARPTGGVPLAPDHLVSALMVGGLAISIAAKLALNRSFGLVAANRGVKRGGPYLFVRHPMYLGYFVAHIGLLLGNFSWQLICIYSLAWAAQLLRIVEEEKFLMRDPAYVDFAAATKWRILPAIF